MKNKMYKKRIVSLILASVVIFSGCTTKTKKEEPKERSGKTIETSKLATSIRDKYVDSEKYEYVKDKKRIDRDESISITIEFDPAELGMENYTDIVAVYQDPDLTQRVGTHFEQDKETGEIKIIPPKWSLGTISTLDLKKDTPGNDGTSQHLFDKGELKDWGNLPQYYMVQFVDLTTGHKLDKPIITVVHVKTEVTKAPSVAMHINEEGLPTFSWDRVKGATTYYVMEMDYSKENGFIGNGTVVGSTEDNTWTPESAKSIRTYNISEAERRTPENIEKYGEGTDPVQKEAMYESYYSVIAASEDGTSPISNVFSEKEIAQKVPYTEEVAMSNEEDGSRYAKKFTDLPSYRWVTMCDGTLVQKIINYDLKGAKETTESWSEYEAEDMSDLKIVEVNIVKIPYTIDGTGFSNFAVVETYNKKSLEKDLEELGKRQEALRNRAGTRDIELKEEVEGDETKDSGKVYETNYSITANSALSEYLASNMLTGKEVIELKDFPESVDQTFLLDAWMEAVYQNPLILGVQSAYISKDGSALKVSYDDEPVNMQKKQEAIVKEVHSVVEEIITKDMSELEKEIKINNYLCEIAEYDTGALENAEKNNFETVDKEFNDSFTPYGVLVNKVGVCASYAGAFKLLADAAGLESIVVTGYLEGNLPHAWNKINVDGEWQIVDSTNNDNEIMFNALLNLPDEAADKVLVEDDRFALDSKIANYSAKTTEKEYYRIENKYFEQDEIITSLVSELRDNGVVTLRTDYELNDDQFYSIGQEVINEIGYGADKLSGYYWMGVIHLTTKN